MFWKRIDLFTLAGFRIGLDLSWFLLAALLVWSLSAGYFPYAVPGLEQSAYLWMGVIGAIGLFASIVFHELAHAIVARRFDLPIAGITLFIFGGVAEMEDEPPTAASEFLVAVAGPIASFALAGGLYLLLLGGAGGLGAPVEAVIAYLALINAILAVFNLLPAFPLDGGRILRSGLWWWSGDLRRATRIASICGAVLGIALMGLGVLNIVGGNFVGGMWQMLIGFFIQSAAGASRTQVELREGLKGIRVRQVMRHDPVTVPATLSVAELVDRYVYRHYHKLYPVVDQDGRPLGCVRLAAIGRVPQEAWGRTTVREIMEPCGDGNVLSPSDTALQALKRMGEGGASRFLVVDKGRLVGIVTMRDILNFMAVRLELENRTPPPAVRQALAEGSER